MKKLPGWFVLTKGITTDYCAWQLLAKSKLEKDSMYTLRNPLRIMYFCSHKSLALHTGKCNAKLLCKQKYMIRNGFLRVHDNVQNYNTLVKSVWPSYLPSRHVIVFQPALGLGWLSATLVRGNSALTSRLYSLILTWYDALKTDLCDNGWLRFIYI